MTVRDQQGYNIVAGKDASGRHVGILISDFQSSHDRFRLRVTNLPWDGQARFAVKLSLLDGKHCLDVVDQRKAQDREITIETSFRSPSVCLVEIDRNFEEDGTP